MDNFDFSLYQNIGTSGADYIKKYKLTLPPRIYHVISDYHFASFDDFYKQLAILLDSYTSQYLFPGDICFFYPSLQNPKASRPTTCHFSAAKIVKGESYYTYRPLLENITRGMSIQFPGH